MNVLKKIIFILLMVVFIKLIFVWLQTDKLKTANLVFRSEGKIISGFFDPTKQKPDDEWKKLLTSQQYYILREQGTELPFTGGLLHNKQKGTYVSVGCEEPVFRSEQKYDSGTGWPSFWAPISDDALVLNEDANLGEKRIEILDKCGGHLGHIFDDGPQPTGKRYCINSAALRFIPDESQ